MKIEEYAKHCLSSQVFNELRDAVATNRWLQWDHFDQVRAARGAGGHGVREGATLTGVRCGIQGSTLLLPKGGVTCGRGLS